MLSILRQGRKQSPAKVPTQYVVARMRWDLLKLLKWLGMPVGHILLIAGPLMYHRQAQALQLAPANDLAWHGLKPSHTHTHLPLVHSSQFCFPQSHPSGSERSWPSWPKVLAVQPTNKPPYLYLQWWEGQIFTIFMWLGPVLQSLWAFPEHFGKPERTLTG